MTFQRVALTNKQDAPHNIT